MLLPFRILAVGHYSVPAKIWRVALFSLAERNGGEWVDFVLSLFIVHPWPIRSGQLELSSLRVISAYIYLVIALGVGVKCLLPFLTFFIDKEFVSLLLQKCTWERYLPDDKVIHFLGTRL